MNSTALAVLRELSVLDGVECTPDLVFSCGGERIAEAEAVGETLLLEILCHPLDVPALVEEYACCSLSGSGESRRIRMFFVTGPSPEERSALLEAFRSALDRVAPGGPGTQDERSEDG